MPPWRLSVLQQLSFGTWFKHSWPSFPSKRTAILAFSRNHMGAIMVQVTSHFTLDLIFTLMLTEFAYYFELQKIEPSKPVTL